MAAEPVQLALEENQHICPTCRGNRRMIRILYLDEIMEGGPLTEICRCRTCDGQGVVAWDPLDVSIPF